MTLGAERGLQLAKQHRSLPDILSADERAKSPSQLAQSRESYIDPSSPNCKSPAQMMEVDVVRE